MALGGWAKPKIGRYCWWVGNLARKLVITGFFQQYFKGILLVGFYWWVLDLIGTDGWLMMVGDGWWWLVWECPVPYRFLKDKKMGKINLDLVFTYINGFWIINVLLLCYHNHSLCLPFGCWLNYPLFPLRLWQSSGLSWSVEYIVNLKFLWFVLKEGFFSSESKVTYSEFKMRQIGNKPFFLSKSDLTEVHVRNSVTCCIHVYRVYWVCIASSPFI